MLLSSPESLSPGSGPEIQVGVPVIGRDVSNVVDANNARAQTRISYNLPRQFPPCGNTLPAGGLSYLILGLPSRLPQLMHGVSKDRAEIADIDASG